MLNNSFYLFRFQIGPADHEIYEAFCCRHKIMILQPYRVYIVDKIDVRHAVYLQILVVQDVDPGYKGYSELFSYQRLYGVFIRTLADYIRLYSQISVQLSASGCSFEVMITISCFRIGTNSSSSSFSEYPQNPTSSLPLFISRMIDEVLF